MSVCEKIENYQQSQSVTISKVGSINKFYFAYQTEFVKIKNFVLPTTHNWLSSAGRSQLAIGR
jgi:hypothetical protein